MSDNKEPPMVKCPCCGSPVDAAGESYYPFDDDKITQDKPVPNLLMIDAAGPNETRILFLCHQCWHRLEGDNGPDMWTTSAAWKSLNPVTPFDRMPPESAKKTVTDSDGTRRPDWNPLSYLEFFEVAR